MKAQRPRKRRRKRKCKCCRELYMPDARHFRDQQYCAKAACRDASQRASHRRWLRSDKGADYRDPAENKRRVQAWRTATPGYRTGGRRTMGCMSPMALNKGASTVDTSSKSIAVFTLRTQNAYKPSFRPNAKGVEVVSERTSAGRKYKVDSAYKKDGDALEYLVSVDVDPGTHTLRNVMGQSLKFPLVTATFLFPVDGKFDVPKDSVTYIGHVNMVNRKGNCVVVRRGAKEAQRESTGRRTGTGYEV